MALLDVLKAAKALIDAQTAQIASQAANVITPDIVQAEADLQASISAASVPAPTPAS